MTSAKADALKLRLFIEGVECPVISAQIQMQPNGPIQAAIQVPPSPLGTQLLPRSTVHLFFLDMYEEQNPYISLRGSDAKRSKQKDPTAYQRNIQDSTPDESVLPGDLVSDAMNVRYKLVFGGEVVGYQNSKNPSSQSLVLQCADFSIYWDTAYQFNNTDLFGPGGKAMFSGGSTNLLTDFLSSPGEVVSSLLHQKSVNFPALPGFAGGLVRMMEAIGGSYYADDKFAGQNVFHSIAELRLRTTQQLTVLPHDPTSARLLGAGSYDGLFGRTLGNLGEQVSIRTVLTALTGVIFHETYPISTPKYVPGSDGTVGGQLKKKLRQIPEAAQLYGIAHGGRTVLERFREDVTAPLAGEEAPEKDYSIRRLSTLQRNLRAAVTMSRLKNYPAAASLFTQAAASLNIALSSLRRTWTPGVVPGKKVLDGIAKINDTIATLVSIENLDVNITPKAKQVPARLNAHILKPDIWFGPPPRCNVIFADRYDQRSFGRNWLAEPTRFLLKVHNEFIGEDELFGSYYYAPRARTVKGQKKTLQNLFEGDIFEHELYTGILPVFEKMGEMNIFAVRSGTVNGKTPKVGLAQRSANFLYFKHRYAGRQLPVAGPFNPYLACGFPALVMDRYVDPETLEEYRDALLKSGKRTPEISKMLGTHYVGSIAELTHELSQDNARTSTRLAFAREYNEITKFFGPAIREDQEVQKRFGSDVARTTTVAAISRPHIGGIGPNYGVIERVVDVSDQYTNTDPQSATSLPLWTGSRRSGTGELKDRVVTGPNLRALDYGPAVVELMGDPYTKVKFNAYLIEERVPRYRTEIVDLPAEELIRPGWYSDDWHPSKIGEAYQYFLGTGSITDATQISDPDGMPSIGQQVGNLQNEEIDALVEATRSKTGEAPDFSSAVALLALDKGASTEQAVEFLVATYSYAKQAGISIDEFIRTYTWRPIATMVDMFGTHDLQYDEQGQNVVSGVEGFHSKAFGPYQDLFGLVSPEITEILGISRVSAARAMGDVRGPRRQAAVEFVESLQMLKAFLG